MLTAQSWPLGVQRSENKEAGCYQVKLKGNPWYTSDGIEVNQARLLAMRIMSVMDQLGYELAGSVDMSVAGGENISERMYPESAHPRLTSSGLLVFRLQNLTSANVAFGPNAQTLSNRAANGATCPQLYRMFYDECGELQTISGGCN